MALFLGSCAVKASKTQIERLRGVGGCRVKHSRLAVRLHDQKFLDICHCRIQPATAARKGLLSITT